MTRRGLKPLHITQESETLYTREAEKSQAAVAPYECVSNAVFCDALESGPLRYS